MRKLKNLALALVLVGVYGGFWYVGNLGRDEPEHPPKAAAAEADVKKQKPRRTKQDEAYNYGFVNLSSEEQIKVLRCTDRTGNRKDCLEAALIRQFPSIAREVYGRR